MNDENRREWNRKNALADKSATVGGVEGKMQRPTVGEGDYCYGQRPVARVGGIELNQRSFAPAYFHKIVNPCVGDGPDRAPTATV